jgi:SAM-dependent methyltransferase
MPNAIISPALSDQARLRAFWNARYAQFSLSESGWFGAGERLNERIYACKIQALGASLRALGRRPNESFSVLDAGCGQGYFARFYRSAFPAARYVGIDISERAVQHLQSVEPCAEFHVGDLAAWADPAGRRFDVVQSLEVLHLILDDDVFARAIGNLSALIADRGALLVTAALPERTEERAGYLRYRSYGLWSETLRACGLAIVESRPIYYWLPAGGPSNRYWRHLFTRLGVDALYFADRAALSIGLPHPRAIGLDCTMRLLTIRRA